MVTRSNALAAFAVVLTSVLIGAPAASADPTSCHGLTPTITGNGVVDGTSGNDIILTGSGDDVIDGAGGRDVICAGDGNDQIDVSSDERGFIFGGDGDDQLTGSPGNDLIDGGRGTDDCVSQGGTDKIYGCTFPTEFVVGQSAPDVAAKTAFDNRFRLADLAGQNVVIDFSTRWCGPSHSMAIEAANTQATLRKAKVPFTYVLAEIEGSFAGTPSVRTDAEYMVEGYQLSQLPVLHAAGITSTPLEQVFDEWSVENNVPDPVDSEDRFFPTLVFINTAGVVTEVHPGPLTGQEILDRVKTGLTEPAPLSPANAPLTGVDIESLRAMLDPLTINAASKAKLQDQLTSALRAMEVRLKPKVSSCDWMKQFDATLKKTTGIGAADRADLVGMSGAIKSKLGCK